MLKVFNPAGVFHEISIAALLHHYITTTLFIVSRMLSAYRDFFF